MSVTGNRFHLTRGKSAKRRSMLIACGAVCNAAMFSFMVPGAQAQSSYIWTSSSSGNWSDGTKWMGGSAPVFDPNGDVNLEFSGPGTYAANNNLGPFGVYNTTFDGGNGTTTLTGGDINLFWPLSETNNPAFADNSTNPVTIDNNVTFEATAAQDGGTQEYFVVAPGSTATFNGTVNLTGGCQMHMTNGEASNNLGGPGGTMIWTQPVTFTNNPNSNYGGYFAFRILEGTFEMGGYTIDNGTSNNPIVNVSGVNVLQTTGSDGLITHGPNAGTPGAPNNGAVTDMYLGPEDRYTSYNPNSGVLLHPNDVVAFYLIAGGESMNQPIQVGDAGTITIGGINTSGTVTFNDFFKTLPTDGNGIINGVSQTIYFSAAAGGTVLQNFTMVGGGGGSCGASVDKIGPGTWIVAGGGDNDNGEQAYYGNTTVRDGTLELEYDDTGVNMVTLPTAAKAAGAPYYADGLDGGSLGFNDPSNAVQLGDNGTLATDNIALLTLTNPGAPGPRQVLHYISVNSDNPSGTTTIGVGDNGSANFSGNVLLNESAILTGGSGGVANFSGMISGVGGITASGSGTVNLSGTNAYLGSTHVAGGSLILTSSGTIASTTITVDATTNANINGLLSGAPALTANGHVTFGAADGVNGATTNHILPRNVVALTVGSQGTVALATATDHSARQVLVAASLSNAGLIDLSNNDMIVQSGSLATITSEIAQGRGANGLWTGSGITSSSAAATPATTALGVELNNNGSGGKLFTTFDGQTVTNTDVLVKYTYAGDADLSGTVTAADYMLIDNGFNSGGAKTGWRNGDFNYDGVINGDDYTLIDNAFNTQGSVSFAGVSAGPAEMIATNTDQIAVPEPGTLSLITIGAIGLLNRRRRSN